MEDTREDTHPQGTRSRLLRTPPHNLEAERALLGAIILKSEVMHDVSVTVYPESFYADKHREIYRAILDTIDILSITTKLRTRNLLVKRWLSPFPHVFFAVQSLIKASPFPLSFHYSLTTLPNSAPRGARGSKTQITRSKPHHTI